MINRAALVSICLAFVLLVANQFLDRFDKGVPMERRCRNCHEEIIEGAPRHVKDIGAQVRGFCSKLCWDFWEYENKQMRKAAQL